jgi:hypothetical protein
VPRVERVDCPGHAVELPGFERGFDDQIPLTVEVVIFFRGETEIEAAIIHGILSP